MEFSGTPFSDLAGPENAEGAVSVAFGEPISFESTPAEEAE